MPADGAAAPGPGSVDARRLRSVVEGRLLEGPETLQVNLRNACNLNCVFCWNHSPRVAPRPQAWHRERLSTAHLDNVIAALPRLRPGHVLLSGRGEPLLHPEVGRLLAALADQGIPATVQTNGVAGPSPEALVRWNVARLLVNVSAGTAESYEAVHPGRGRLFEPVRARLDRLAELRGGDGSPEVTLVAIVHAGRPGVVPEVVELARRVGAAAVYLKGMEVSPDVTTPGELMLAEAARRRVLSDLEDARVHCGELGIRLRAEHLHQVATAQTPAGSFTDAIAAGEPCYMGWYYLRVTCDGRVMFCCKDKPVGHLDRAPLQRIWRSVSYHHLRLAGRDRDLSAGLLDERCRGCSSFVRNRQIGAELRTGARAPA